MPPLDNAADPALISSPNRIWGHADATPTPCGSRPGWAVILSHPRAEAKAANGLAEQGFEVYLPLTHTSRGLRPLFSRYAFVHLDGQTPWTPVIYTRGVYDLIRSRDTGIPHIARPGAVEALQALEAVRRTPTTPDTPWRLGAPCRLAGGALAGHEGVVMEAGKHTATVAIMLFGHLRNASVPLSYLKPRDNAWLRG